MTLVIAGVARSSALILSDRRISRPRGLREDSYNKMTVLFAADARVVLAFTGLARHGDYDTADTITDTLVHRVGSNRNFLPMRDHLMNAFSDRLSEIALPKEKKRLSIILAGYVYADDPQDEQSELVTAVLYRMSNFQRGATSLVAARDTFHIESTPPREATSDAPYLFATAGATQGLPPRQIEGLEKLLHEERPPHAVASKALDIGLEAARSPLSGGAIGTGWSSAILPLRRAHPVRVQYHSSAAEASDFGTTVVDASGTDQPVVALSNLVAETIEPHSFGFQGTPRNAPCPCASGRKYKRCHGHPSASQGGWFLNPLLRT